MSKLLTILTFLLFGCTTDKYNLFKIRHDEKATFLDLVEINDIRKFNTYFWTADSVNNDFFFTAKFDFEKGNFSKKSDKGIKIEGLPYSCLTDDCKNRNGLKLYLSDTYEILNDELKKIDKDQTKDLITKNILNYGQDPSLSDNPKEAITEVYLNFDQEISKTGHVFKLIADSYIELIQTKRSQTKKTTEQLTNEFPLIIQLRQKMSTYELAPIINQDEISEEIEIDTVGFIEK